MSEGIQRSGILFVLSAPSGAGKSTLRDSLLAREPMHYAVSSTTRAPREGEVDGRDYHFTDRETFLRDIESGEFLEHAEVHGNHYGTRRDDVLDHLRRGHDVLLDIDVAGAAQIRSLDDPAIRGALVDIFILPPGIAELRRRLQGRGSESEEQLSLRLRNAEEEMRHWPLYTYTIRSGSREEDLANLLAIVHAERSRSSRLRREDAATP